MKRENQDYTNTVNPQTSETLNLEKLEKLLEELKMAKFAQGIMNWCEDESLTLFYAKDMKETAERVCKRFPWHRGDIKESPWLQSRQMMVGNLRIEGSQQDAT